MLNSEQIKAVNTPSGAKLLVVAGPGSGKTKMVWPWITKRHGPRLNQNIFFSYALVLHVDCSSSCSFDTKRNVSPSVNSGINVYK